jgi:hypothetical protein
VTLAQWVGVGIVAFYVAAIAYGEWRYRKGRYKERSGPMGSVQQELPQADDKLVETPAPTEQAPDTPGNDENGDGLDGGQATADTVGDVLGI